MRIYLAAPVVGRQSEVLKVIEALVRMGYDVYDPAKLKVPNAWNMPMEQWGRCVFSFDVKAIDDADAIVVCDYGRQSTGGTCWEAGYAFAKGKPVYVIQMPAVDEVSLMVRNGCTRQYSYKDFTAETVTLEPVDYKNCVKEIIQN